LTADVTLPVYRPPMSTPTTAMTPPDRDPSAVATTLAMLPLPRHA